jgi:hypothetical protein
MARCIAAAGQSGESIISLPPHLKSDDKSLHTPVSSPTANGKNSGSWEKDIAENGASTFINPSSALMLCSS